MHGLNLRQRDFFTLLFHLLQSPRQFVFLQKPNVLPAGRWMLGFYSAGACLLPTCLPICVPSHVSSLNYCCPSVYNCFLFSLNLFHLFLVFIFVNYLKYIWNNVVCITQWIYLCIDIDMLGTDTGPSLPIAPDTQMLRVLLEEWDLLRSSKSLSRRAVTGHHRANTCIL